MCKFNYVDCLNLDDLTATQDGHVRVIWASRDGSDGALIQSGMRPSTDSGLVRLLELPAFAAGGAEIEEWLFNHSEQISSILSIEKNDPETSSQLAYRLQADFDEWAKDQLPLWITVEWLWDGVNILRDFEESGFSRADYPRHARNDTIHYIIGGESAVDEYLASCLDRAFPLEKSYDEIRQDGFEFDGVESNDSLLSLEWDGQINMWSRETEDWVLLHQVPPEALEAHKMALLRLYLKNHI